MSSLSGLSVKIAKNTLYQLIGKAITTTSTLFITFLLTRRFGPSGYGEFSLMLAFPAFFYMAVDFGLNAIFAKKSITENDETLHINFGKLVSLRFFWSLSLIALALLLLILFPYSQNLKIGIAIGLFSILTQGLITSANAIFQLKARYDLSTISVFFGSALFLVLIYFGLTSLNFAIFAYSAGGLVTALTSLFLAKRLISKNTFSAPIIDTNYWRELFLPSIPLGMTAFLSVTTGKADSILLSLLKKTEDVGYYGIAYKIFEVILVFPTFFMNVVYPILLGKKEESTGEFATLTKKIFVFLGGLGMLGGLVGILLAPYLIRLIGGDSFSPSVLALRLLLAGLPIFFLTSMLFWYLIIFDRQKYLPFIYGASAIFNILGNLLIIPRYSFYGAAVCTSVTEGLILILLVIFRIFT